jgi:hypothetical protein
MNRFAEISEV